jgi:Excalibur calcium-binding domain
MSQYSPPTASYVRPAAGPDSSEAHVVSHPRPWYRKLRFMLPIAAVGGVAVGAVSAGAGSAANLAPSGAVRTVTATSTAPAVTITTKVTVTKTAPPSSVTKTAAAPNAKAVQAVLRAWTDAGPQPDVQAAAMRRLRAEWPTLANALEAATGTKVPAARAASRPATRPTTAPAPQPADVYYANCAAARAGGVAPIYAGQPGYRAGLDRDGDGVACE